MTVPTAPSAVSAVRPDPTAVAALATAGVASPEWDARLLQEHAQRIGVPLQLLLERRAAREPLQHILGVAWFRHLELAVGPGVFVPRPESELLVDAALAALAGHDKAAARPVVVDLCAGSGAIGLSIGHERALRGLCTELHLVEADGAALPWLRRNANAVRGDREAAMSVTVHHADLDDTPRSLDGAVDVVTANPPYLPTSTAAELDVETARHDPAVALWGGMDGMTVIRRVVVAASRLLRPGGSLIVEHDSGHDLTALLGRATWRGVRRHRDLTGRWRFTTAVAT